MIIYNSPINKIDADAFDDLSLKVAEIEGLLIAVIETGDCYNHTGCIVSAIERLAHWLQSDVQALHKAYIEQHGGYTVKQPSDHEGGE